MEVLRVGVRVRGAEDDEGITVRKENVKKGVEELLEGGEEGREIRERAKRLAVKAQNAMDGKQLLYLSTSPFLVMLICLRRVLAVDQGVLSIEISVS